MKHIIHLTGMTGAGKSTLLQELGIPREQIWDVRDFYERTGLLQYEGGRSPTTSQTYQIPVSSQAQEYQIGGRGIGRMHRSFDYKRYNELIPDMLEELKQFLRRDFPFHVIESSGINSSINGLIKSLKQTTIYTFCLRKSDTRKESPDQKRFNEAWSKKAALCNLIPETLSLIRLALELLIKKLPQTKPHRSLLLEILNE